MDTYVDMLFAELEAGRLRCNWWQDPLLKYLEKWVALHELDRDVLKRLAGWPIDRRYKVDPLPQRLSGAFADFLYGEDPTIEPKSESDAGNLDEIVKGNDYHQALWDAVDKQSGEGEVYWHIYTDEGQSDVPIIDWCSRTMTVPYYRGRRLMALGIISVVKRDDNGVWRWVTAHQDKFVENRLYYSPYPGEDEQAPSKLYGIGQRVNLQENEATADLDEVWGHDLPMLAGRVPNKLRNNMGISDYDGVEDLLLDLNETHSIDAENYRLAGKKRAVMPEKYADEEGKSDVANEDVFWAQESVDEMLEGGKAGPFTILEYSYDGDAAIARKDDLTSTILTRVGLTRHFTDPSANEGSGASGVALRTRFIPTTLAARGKSRRWDRTAPYVLMLAMMVDALPENRGGFGRSYSAANELPKIERGSILPEDETEEFTKHGLAVSQGLESLETALRELHPRWTDGQVQEEIKKIREDQAPPALEEEGPVDDQE